MRGCNPIAPALSVWNIKIFDGSKWKSVLTIIGTSVQSTSGCLSVLSPGSSSLTTLMVVRQKLESFSLFVKAAWCIARRCQPPTTPGNSSSKVILVFGSTTMLLLNLWAQWSQLSIMILDLPHSLVRSLDPVWLRKQERRGKGWRHGDIPFIRLVVRSCIVFQTLCFLW